jgi:hypothetical protein
VSGDSCETTIMGNPLRRANRGKVVVITEPPDGRPQYNHRWRNMNVKKGTFRLWVVLSVFFVICVAVVSYSDIRIEFRNANTDWNAIATQFGGTNLVPADCEKARGTLERDYTRDADGVCWYEFSKFRSLYPEYKDVSDKELDRRLYEKAGKPLAEFHPWAKVSKTAGIAIGVPLGFLALGWSLFWAFAGFSSKPVAIPSEHSRSQDVP